MKKKFTAFQEKWLKALESGKYKQTQGVLKRISTKGNFSYCCLGVAAELLECEVRPIYESNIYLTANGVAGPKIIKNLHLVDHVGRFVEGFWEDGSSDREVVASLAGANDEAKWSFNKIAKYCRQHPENVFTNFQGK